MSIIRDGAQSADLDVPVASPTLNLDFANSQELDPRITFTRGSIGTCVNRNGFIETIPANQPRFDYDPVTGECKGLLIEESRANIVLNSTTLSSHSNSGTTTVLTNETTSPDGTSNAYKIIGNSGVKTRESIFTNAFTMNANSSYTASVFLKGTETRRYVVIWFDNTPPGSAPVEGPYYGTASFIDLLTGTSSNPSITKMIPYGNGWYRCYITATVGASNLTNVYFNVSMGSPNGFSDTGNPSQYKYVGDGTSGIYYWGPQVEVGAFPTSYIPTTVSTVTRSADNASMTGTNFSSWYNQTGYSVFTSHIAPIPQTIYFPRIFNIGTDASDINRLNFYHTPSTIGYRVGMSVIENNSITNVDFSTTTSQGTKLKLAGAFAENNSSLYINGSIIGTDIKCSINSVTRNILNIGSTNNSQGYLNSTIAKFTYYPKALSPAQLQYLTQ